ncbi:MULTISPECIES: hypothetical protein [Corynebacterium]|uniref:hypothetical protein n=1 Tax=Corynebacterium TaxID=1716 RepID=UPI0008A8A886|nr:MULTISPECIES: hypothetical protein [Corynebacterium]OHO78045.1 hypothetical protein HMPREF2736_11430 [Corynebacterium sp. HMSC036E10]
MGEAELLDYGVAAKRPYRARVLPILPNLLVLSGQRWCHGVQQKQRAQDQDAPRHGIAAVSPLVVGKPVKSSQQIWFAQFPPRRFQFEKISFQSRPRQT